MILKSILTGLGMFVLLRHLRPALPISLPLALTYQFASCFAFFFGHPWIQASFAYYPFLWTVWSAAIQRDFWRNAGIGAALCGLIFNCGNLQSHAYLFVLGLCFLVGYGFLQRDLLLRVLAMITFSGLIGTALASPVRASNRSRPRGYRKKYYMSDEILPNWPSALSVAETLARA